MWSAGGSHVTSTSDDDIPRTRSLRGKLEGSMIEKINKYRSIQSNSTRTFKKAAVIDFGGITPSVIRRYNQTADLFLDFPLERDVEGR